MQLFKKIPAKVKRQKINADFSLLECQSTEKRRVPFFLSIFKKKEKKRKLFFDRFFCLECVGDDWL
jgi:hypothetical protein